MELIVNEVELKKAQREQEKREQLLKIGKKPEEVLIDTTKDVKQEVVVCRNATDIQKRKLDKLMKDPTRDVYIPEPRKERKLREPPEFVRHVMGSSAGAGSGEFHVYRGIRKREKKRQEFLDWKSQKIEQDEQYQSKIENNKQQAEELTAKKRAKRQKKKQKQNLAKKLKQNNDKDQLEVSSGSEHKEEKQYDEEDEEEEQPHFEIGGK